MNSMPFVMPFVHNDASPFSNCWMPWNAATRSDTEGLATNHAERYKSLEQQPEAPDMGYSRKRTIKLKVFLPPRSEDSARMVPSPEERFHTLQ